MRVYRNATDSDIVVNVDTGERIKQHTIRPGQRFSFCQMQSNAQDITTQLEAAGAVMEQQV